MTKPVLTFAFDVITRTGYPVAAGTVEARTPAAAKGKVRRMPSVGVWDMIWIGEGFVPASQ